MQTEQLYRDYPDNAGFMAHYAMLQERYFKDSRKSDLVLAAMVGSRMDKAGRDDLAVLDIGCSTGALMYHLHAAYPALRLTGGDLSRQVIERCRADERLAGLPFEVMDILELQKPPGGYDIVIGNAIFYGFSNRLLTDALARVASVLNPGGALLVFDYLHPYHQDVEIVEYSETFPQGHPLHYRSFRTVAGILAGAGFAPPEFKPFDLPLDIPDPGYESVHTHTKTLADGSRLQFRGILTQPWCHMMAERI